MKRMISMLFGTFCMMAMSVVQYACSNDDDLILTRADAVELGNFFDMASPTDVYQYPYVPNTPEWLELHSHGMQAVYAALEIPESILKNMSSAGLVQTFLDYTYCAEFMLSSSTFWIAFESELEHHPTTKDIYAVLRNRSDAGRAVMYVFKTYDFKGDHLFPWAEFMALHMMASVDDIYGKLSSDEKRAAVAIILQRLEEWNREMDAFDGQMANLASFLVGRIMRSVKYEPLMKLLNSDNRLNSFLDTQDLMCDNYDQILDIAKSYIK
ncbi:MAG: hypothetical protein IJ845_03160 [Bacteroidaceae bacterium]|nr:hypothetical protein [Bacteroidaceae bacterium]